MNRIASITLRGVLVATLSLGGASARIAGAGEAAPDPAADLRKASSPSTSLAERRALVGRVLASGRMPDADAAVRVAVRLVAEDVATAGEATDLLRRALEMGDVSEETRDQALAFAPRIPSGSADLAAFAILCGDRAGGYARLRDVDLTPAARAVLGYDAPEQSIADGATRLVPDATWDAHVAAADALGKALRDDPKVARAGLDATLALAKGGTAMPYLLAVAERRPKAPPGLLARRVRAILVLGMAGDRRARAVLEPALMDNVEAHDEGWARVAAATALGDLGDPAAIPALCHVLFYLGDVHRVTDAWDYPGKGNTDVPEETWSEAAYYAIDEAAADALLRLGVGNAAEWLLRGRLQLGATRWRIRVLQDALDAIRRSFPSAPVADYVPDGGLPDRDRAGKALLAWWRTGPKLAHPLVETDRGFTEAARALVGRLGEKRVLELQIAEKSSALIGPAITPWLLEGFAASKSKVQRAEIAGALGAVRDRRAVGPLLEMTKDEVKNVRAVAAESLASYLESATDPLYSGTAAAGPDAIVARWIALLDDDAESPRVSAMRALVSAPPRADVLAAVKAHAAASHPENDFADYVLAEQVVLLVQTGEGLDAIAAVLVEPVLFRRRTAWELLVRALRLDPASFDPMPGQVPLAPGDPVAKPLDLATVRAALARRRGP